MSDPTLNVEIIGNKIVTDLYSTEDIVVIGKSEIELNSLVLSDSWKTVPISKIGTISKIIANVTTDSTTVDPSANLQIIHASGTVNLPFNGILVYSVEETFANSITGVNIGTSSTTAMNCNIAVYGI
jgi:hypothetical protein